MEQISGGESRRGQNELEDVIGVLGVASDLTKGKGGVNTDTRHTGEYNGSPPRPSTPRRFTRSGAA